MSRFSSFRADPVIEVVVFQLCTIGPGAVPSIADPVFPYSRVTQSARQLKIITSSPSHCIAELCAFPIIILAVIVLNYLLTVFVLAENV